LKARKGFQPLFFEFQNISMGFRRRPDLEGFGTPLAFTNGGH
jgi:hypothetical protein